MVSTNTTISLGLVFLIQTGSGILGNSLLLCLFIFSLLTGNTLRPIDLILNQLVIANNLVLFSKGIPQTMAAFGLKSFLGDTGCKCVFYFHRVSRGVSLSTTSLLSGFQVIKLCPTVSRWMELRMRSPKCISFCCFLCWILHLVLNTFIMINITGPTNSKNMSIQKNFVYCVSSHPDRLIVPLHAAIFFSIDAMCLGFVILASGSMVLLLHRHRKRVQYIHSRRLSPRTSHEVRATCTILVLVSSFVLFYSLSSILTLSFSLTINPSQWLVHTGVLVASCFPTFSPFVLITSDTRVSQLCFACWAKKAMFNNLVKCLLVF
ncbi:vomeronasal type-1 receptor 1-like [Cynocephalus volans]|uniref:vomeronasal type-1 receptor 1-like n=1 Tax=Cynocephalus volans TaxID=110931 RepID=UPI002FCA9D89